MKKPIIISIVNKKGGVSKTTTAINFSYSLTLPEFGKKNVLLVDLDSQCNASTGLGFPKEKIDKLQEEREGIYRILTEKLPLAYGIYETNFPRLDLVPAMPLLVKAKQELLSQFDSTTRLKKAIDSCKDILAKDYDFIVIDCSPALELLEFNALMASDYVIIPVFSDEFSFDGIMPVLNAIRDVQEVNTGLQILGILFTRIDVRSKAIEGYREAYKAIDPDKVFTTFIDQNIDVVKALEQHQPVHVYNPLARASQKYIEFAHEVMLKIDPNHSPNFDSLNEERVN